MKDFERMFLTEEQKVAFDIKQLENETKEEKSKRNHIITEIITTIVFALLTLLILGVANLIEGGFDFSMYSSMEFWTTYTTTQIASWFVRIWVWAVRKNYFKKSDSRFLLSNYRIEFFAKADYEKPYIDEEVEKDRFNRKKTAFINQQKRLLIGIIKKYELTNVVKGLNNYINSDFSSLEAFDIESNIKYRTTIFNWFRSKKSKIDLFVKKLEKVNLKVKDIFYSMSDIYIKQNIDNIKVNFNDVSRSILLSGVSVGSNNLLGNNYEKGTTSKFIKLFMPTFLMFTVLSFLLLPFLAGSEFVRNAEAWGRFILSLFMTTFAGLIMFISSSDLFEETELRSIRAREDTLKNYYYYKIGKPPTFRINKEGEIENDK